MSVHAHVKIETHSVDTYLPADLLVSHHPIERVGGLIDESFGKVLVRVEVFKCQIAVVADLAEGFQNSRPVGSSIKQGTKGF